jgi:uncharacterized delta-60 repeat protein
VTLSSLGSTGAIADYEWDVEYDPAAGFRVDATGPTATFAGLDGPSVHVVALRVRTVTGVTAIDVAQVRVGNVAPAVTALAPATATTGAPYVLQLSYADPGQDAPKSWKVEWGDGAVETFQGNPPSVSHVYATPGAHAVYVYTFQDDGKILAVGRTLLWTPPYKGSLALVRFNPDGSPDTSFDADGVVVVNPGSDAVGTSAVVDASGRVTVAGRVDNQLAVFRYLPDGRPDTDFGQGGVVISPLNPGDAYPLMLVQQPDGRLIVSTWSAATDWITRLIASPLTVQVQAPATAPAGTGVPESPNSSGSGSTTKGSTKPTVPKPAPKPATKPQLKPLVTHVAAPVGARPNARFAPVPAFSIRKIVDARRGASVLFA